MTCENLHVEEQHQLKALLQKYENLFDGTLGEFNMEPISLQLMEWTLIVSRFMRVLTRFLDQWNNNYKRERKLSDWWTLESFKKTIPLNGLPHHLRSLKKTEQ
jgi:hypothetical protein